MINEHDDSYFIYKLSWIGKLMWKVYAVNIFRDGDGGSFIYNKWHPLTYVFMLISIVFTFVMEGYEGVSREWNYSKFYWDYTDYWKKPENEIVWIKRD